MCTYVRSGVVLTIQDVLFKDTYMFLLLHVRAMRKVSYMRYKQHLGESCNVTTTFKEVLYVLMDVRVSCSSSSRTFYWWIPICSCSYMSGLREKYHICDISNTWERVVMYLRRKREYCCVYVYTFGCCANHPWRFIDGYLYILAPTCQGYAKSIIYAISVVLGREL